MRVLGICGSLRQSSINLQVLKAMAFLAPADLQFEVSELPATLPLFNPDLEQDPTAEVTRFRGSVQKCDALVLASPEYAHGISGVMKNTLEWLVSHPAATFKPVAIVNTSRSAFHADSALREVLSTMGVVLVGDESTRLPAFPIEAQADELRKMPGVAASLGSVFDAIRSVARMGVGAPASIGVRDQ